MHRRHARQERIAGSGIIAESRRRTQARGRFHVSPLHVTIVTIGVGLAFVLLVVARGQLSAASVLPGGLTILDVRVGGLQLTEARGRLAARIDELERQPVTLQYAEHTWSVPLAELGVTFDTEAMLADALHTPDGVVRGLVQRLPLIGHPRTVRPRIAIDQQALAQALERLAETNNLAPRDARFQLNGTLLAIEPGHDGVVFDGHQAAGSLLTQVSHNPTKPVAVKLTAVPREAMIDATDLEHVRAEVEQAIRSPLYLVFGERQWQLPPASILLLIRITAEDAHAPAAVSVDQAAARRLAEQLAGVIDHPAVAAAVDETGLAPRLIRSQNGYATRIDDFVLALSDAILGGRSQIDIPVDVIQPTPTTEELLAQLGATEVLGIGTSDFAGSSSGRATNVRIAAELANGVVVPPGGSFSFNQAIGSIVEDPRFVPAGASEDGIPGTSVGGGVCQVTTTIFRAALKAGLPITEWWPHAYRNSYYEQGGWAPGFDASIQQPEGDPFGGSDFRFDNPTAGWLLIQIEVTEETLLTVTIFGPESHYLVEIDDPIFEDLVPGWGESESVDPDLPAGSVVLDQPVRDGMRVTVHRRVFSTDGTLILADTFVSDYRPQGAVYRVSPDMAGTVAGES